MKIIQMIGGIGAIALGVAMGAPQSFLWIKAMTRPRHMPGQLPVYSLEEHTDFMFSLVVGTRSVSLDRWLPVMFAVGCLLVLVGAWNCWRGIASK